MGNTILGKITIITTSIAKRVWSFWKSSGKPWSKFIRNDLFKHTKQHPKCFVQPL